MTAEEAQSFKKAQWGCLAAVFLPLLALVIWFMAAGQGNQDETAYDRIGAWNACTEEVRSRLTQPSTADFPSFLLGGEWSVNRDSTVYRVLSYVESQNAFGATIRTGFECTTRVTLGSASVVSLTLNP